LPPCPSATYKSDVHRRRADERRSGDDETPREGACGLHCGQCVRAGAPSKARRTPKQFCGRRHEGRIGHKWARQRRNDFGLRLVLIRVRYPNCLGRIAEADSPDRLSLDQCDVATTARAYQSRGRLEAGNRPQHVRYVGGGPLRRPADPFSRNQTHPTAPAESTTGRRNTATVTSRGTSQGVEKGPLGLGGNLSEQGP
jgi:hypothetical protein